MLRIHLSDGSTQSFDVDIPEKFHSLIVRLRDSKYQSSITSVSIAKNNNCHSVTRPKGFDRVSFVVESIPIIGKMKGGVRVTCFAGDTRTTLMLHACGNVRVSVARVGYQKYNALLEA